MSIVELFGYSAAVLTTTAFIPQALKVVKTRDTKSLSLPMFLILTFGLLFWTLYGILKEDKAIIIANSVTGMLSVFILITKIRLDVLAKKN